jgi:hypothetical protein
MMVNPISAVRFCANAEAPTANNTSNILEREGAFAKPKADVPTEAPKKKSKLGKSILITAGALVAALGALVALHKTNVFKVLSQDALGTAGFMEKVGHYIGTAAKAVSENTYDKIAKLFTK